MKKFIPLNERLELITEAVLYAKKVRSLGMPSSCYSKAVREPIFFLWECYRKKKYQAARFVSNTGLNSMGEKWGVVYDHCVPFRVLQDKLLCLDSPEPLSIRQVLEQYAVACLITKDEDRLLTRIGLNNKMPEPWNETDVLARYKTAGIDVTENPNYLVS